MKTLEKWYQAQVAIDKLTFDELQLNIVQQFDNLINFFNKKPWFKSYASQGIYLFGSVGRGKSLIVRQAFLELNTQKKLYIHFHQFMHDIHEKILDVTKYKIIFLDEMHINDIANAMLIKKVLSSLIEQKIFVVITSNYEPYQLYQNGLFYERFLPIVKLIEQKLTVLSLNGNTDYRIKNNSYMSQDLDKFFNGIEVTDKLYIVGRDIEYKKQGLNIIWFKFDTICGNGRSYIDYIHIAKKFRHIIIEDITKIIDNDVARRFIWLIDMLYEQKNILVCSFKTDIAEIYTGSKLSFEFKRTLSRLKEMLNL